MNYPIIVSKALIVLRLWFFNPESGVFISREAWSTAAQMSQAQTFAREEFLIIPSPHSLACLVGTVGDLLIECTESLSQLTGPQKRKKSIV